MKLFVAFFFSLKGITILALIILPLLTLLSQIVFEELRQFFITRPITMGTIISAAGFIGLLMLHQTEAAISINLAILLAGLSLTSVGAMNVIILSTPRQSSGVSLGISSLMRIVGASIGPALAGMYMQSNQSILTIGGIAHRFPSLESYNLIFLTTAIVSVVSVVVTFSPCSLKEYSL